MAQVTAAQVKDLREKTGAGMMDCKTALAETGGDMEGAIDWLRKKGLSAAAKKSGRLAAEGLVGVAVKGLTGAVVEVNSETDFVALNNDFQSFVRAVVEVAVGIGGDAEAVAKAAFPGGGTVAEKVNEMIATIGENMNLRRAARLSVGQGVVATYVHNALAEGVGKIAVLVALESAAPASDLEALGKQLAMHVAAANPQAVSRDQVDTAMLDRERAILADQARASGKPENIIDKMVEGRLRRFYEENCLLEQIFVIDNETKVSDAIDAVAKKAGHPIAVKGIVRFALGEGIDKPSGDFASEVAATRQR
ncbi:MAG: translation elongation factor Ts [Proteobacteria bacterium]|nr:translation elongation factor Ts [Pseudomonadota bacterium]